MQFKGVWTVPSSKMLVKHLIINVWNNSVTKNPNNKGKVFFLINVLFIVHRASNLVTFISSNASTFLLHVKIIELKCTFNAEWRYFCYFSLCGYASFRFGNLSDFFVQVLSVNPLLLKAEQMQERKNTLFLHCWINFCFYDLAEYNFRLINNFKISWHEKKKIFSDTEKCQLKDSGNYQDRSNCQELSMWCMYYSKVCF